MYIYIYIYKYFLIKSQKYQIYPKFIPFPARDSATSTGAEAPEEQPGGFFLSEFKGETLDCKDKPII